MSRITVNPVQRFRALLPDSGRTYGTVASVSSGTNTSTVTLQNGSEITVKGSAYSIGDRVLIAGGEIRQQVQDLPFSSVTIF